MGGCAGRYRDCSSALRQHIINCTIDLADLDPPFNDDCEYDAVCKYGNGPVLPD